MVGHRRCGLQTLFILTQRLTETENLILCVDAFSLEGYSQLRYTCINMHNTIIIIYTYFNTMSKSLNHIAQNNSCWLQSACLHIFSPCAGKGGVGNKSFMQWLNQGSIISHASYPTHQPTAPSIVYDYHVKSVHCCGEGVFAVYMHVCT